jgi:hypothetical protein
MKVFSLQNYQGHEGATLLGVFETLEDARRAGTQHRELLDNITYEIVESVLGQLFDDAVVTHYLEYPIG